MVWSVLDEWSDASANNVGPLSKIFSAGGDEVSSDCGHEATGCVSWASGGVVGVVPCVCGGGMTTNPILSLGTIC